jgi:hypothetical protein
MEIGSLELKTNSTNGDDSGSRDFERTLEDLPRVASEHWSAHTSGSSCIGLALLQEIDVSRRQIILLTGPDFNMHAFQEPSTRLVLVVPEATADGRFRSAWMHREMQKPTRRQKQELEVS